jgi:hypothetical protein
VRLTRFLPLVLPLAMAVTSSPAANAAPATAHHRTLVSVGANKSNNWSGYNQGTLEQGSKQFNAIAGDWTVPTATAHKTGESEYSSTWIGIGGGCVDAACNVTDNTLIQTGTEQDWDASTNRAVYSAWYELIPAPGITITGFAVKAGDKIHSEISEGVAGSNVWTILLKNVTTGKSWTTTVPYSSTHATAEWIEETPVVVDSNGNVSVGPLPKLSTVRFNNARTNKANAALKTSEEMQLVDFNNKVLETPSAPDPGKDGFNDCSYASTCATPTSN